MSRTIAPPRRMLDVRGLAPPDGRAALLATFDSLAPGSTFVLVTGNDPRPLLEQLRAARKGLYDWSPVDEDQRTWQVEVARRAAEPGTLRHVTETLTWDHDRLDDLERRAFADLDEGALEAARQAWCAFHRGLNRHIRFEEEVLFPVFEARAGLPHAGPTAAMRSEHREIRMVLEEIARGFDGPREDLEELRRTLHRVLEDHHRREEAILYPAMDGLLSDAESDALVARIQAFPS